MPMLEAVIFDLDGVIINSEPLWTLAETRVFKTVGVELNPEMCSRTVGLDTMATIQYWHDRFPWDNKSFFVLYKELMAEIQRCIDESGKLMDGFLDLLQLLTDRQMVMAVASSSPMSLITFVLKKFHLFDFFRIVQSSETEEYGKPHPAVYIQAARKLNISPLRCLVFEDSFYGALAAKAARMKVVAVPGEEAVNDSRFDFADLKIASLTDFKPSHFDMLSRLT